MGIHPTAIVSPGADIAEDAEIGPYTVIGPGVSIGPKTRIGSHTVIEGPTVIGERNLIGHHAVLGAAPQDVGYRGEDTRLVMGSENVIREYVTIHRATTKQDWHTIVGDRNFIMAYAHVAHDCVLGNNIILTNVSHLGGHIRIDDYAILGGITAVHQFVRIGAHSFMGGATGVGRDLPPYMMASGWHGRLYGVNQKGLIRRGFPQDTIDRLKRAYRIIWRESSRLSEGIRRVKSEMEPFAELDVLLEFIQGSKRGILRAGAKQAGSAT